MAEVQLLSALVRVPLDQVEAGPNARGDVGDVSELALSIKALGMQKPLLACELPNGRYRVLDGHRRLAAATRLGLPHVDVVLRRDAGDALRIQRQLAMHAQAKAFDPIAEANALSTLMFEHRMSREEIARSVGRSAMWVRDRIALLQLSADEQRQVAAGSMAVTAANALLGHRRAEREGRTGGSWVSGASAKPHCTTCRCRAATT